jgi:hypothetical protein
MASNKKKERLWLYLDTDPKFDKALRRAADEDDRTVANYAFKVLLDHLKWNGFLERRDTPTMQGLKTFKSRWHRARANKHTCERTTSDPHKAKYRLPYQREYQKAQRAKVSDAFVRGVLSRGLRFAKRSDIPDSLIRAKRAQILLRRELKKHGDQERAKPGG